MIGTQITNAAGIAIREALARDPESLAPSAAAVYPIAACEAVARTRS